MCWEDSYLFCGRCGTGLHSRPVESVRAGWQCRNCGKSWAADMKFCGSCSAPLQATRTLPPIPIPTSGWIQVSGVVIVSVAALALYLSVSGPEEAKNIRYLGGVPEKTITSPAVSRSWKEVGRWSGAGQKQTESFEVASGEWRISYKTTTAVSGVTLFQIYVYDAATQQLVAVAANRAEAGSETSSVQGHGGGRFYLMINTANNWSVAVEDQR